MFLIKVLNVHDWTPSPSPQYKQSFTKLIQPQHCSSRSPLDHMQKLTDVQRRPVRGNKNGDQPPVHLRPLVPHQPLFAEVIQTHWELHQHQVMWPPFLLDQQICTESAKDVYIQSRHQQFQFQAVHSWLEKGTAGRRVRSVPQTGLKGGSIGPDSSTKYNTDQPPPPVWPKLKHSTPTQVLVFCEHCRCH